MLTSLQYSKSHAIELWLCMQGDFKARAAGDNVEMTSSVSSAILDCHSIGAIV